MTLHELEKDGVDSADSDDEATSDCEAATFVDPKETEKFLSRPFRLPQVIQKVRPALRVGLHYLKPSFLHPRTQKQRALHPTAWLGMSSPKHLSTDVLILIQIYALLQMVFVESLLFWLSSIMPAFLVSLGIFTTAGPPTDTKQGGSSGYRSSDSSYQAHHKFPYFSLYRATQSHTRL